MEKMEIPKKEIIIFTDGGCLGNPGPGGWGAVLSYGNYRKELSGGFRLTTNNRMELTAAIEALKALKMPCNVTLYSDSKYLVDAVNLHWIDSWQKKNWIRKQGPVLNPDLWQELLELLKIHDVKFVWVKGHADNPGNERCDELAKQAASQPNLPIDKNYEQVAENNSLLQQQ